MMNATNLKKNRIICECAECSTLVDVTPEFYPAEEYEADYSCYECGKVVCESCHGDYQSLVYEEDDYQQVCTVCYDKEVAKIEQRKAYETRDEP